jgi:hypothetical protein
MRVRRRESVLYLAASDHRIRRIPTRFSLCFENSLGEFSISESDVQNVSAASIANELTDQSSRSQIFWFSRSVPATITSSVSSFSFWRIHSRTLPISLDGPMTA